MKTPATKQRAGTRQSNELPLQAPWRCSLDASHKRFLVTLPTLPFFGKSSMGVDAVAVTEDRPFIMAERSFSMLKTPEARVDSDDPSLAEEAPAHIETSPTVLHDASDSATIWGARFAIALNCAVVAVLITFIPVEIYINRMDLLSTYDRSLYVVGTTLLGTMIAAYTNSQLRRLWLGIILKQTLPTVTLSNNRASRARTLLGLGNVREQIHGSDITVSMMLVGLLTAAIVTGLTPSTKMSKFPYSIPFTLNQDYGPPCFYQTTKNLSGSPFVWRSSNGSFFNFNESDLRCSTYTVPALLRQPEKYKIGPHSAAYVMMGTTVNVGAVGTPYDTSTGFIDGFGLGSTIEDATFDGHTDHFTSSTACMPNIVSTPYRCYPAGKTSVNNQTLTVSGSGCRATTNLTVRPDFVSTTTTGICINETDIGRAKLVFGGTKGWAERFANAIDEGLKVRSVPPPSRSQLYSVACDLVIDGSVSFRSVNLSATGVWSSLQVTGNEPCTPLDPAGNVVSPMAFLTDEALASGVLAAHQFLAERKYWDGDMQMLWRLLDSSQASSSISHRSVPIPVSPHRRDYYIFNNSRNSLEDTLGMLTAAAMGAYWGSVVTRPLNFASDQVISGGEMCLPGSRVGSGEWWALVLIIPSLYSIVALLYLLQKKRGYRKRSKR
ncbi:hypothetical protein FH972_022042 [Carpinus fangiana]|uniref:Uncharacterized protein n=1 Tax=Carpinus fangiana TaxID=176857 RepID=A0A5N6KR30_9ROSI|nr:hypothetical protein FH972_022042 [Carpinus fangiana]